MEVHLAPEQEVRLHELAEGTGRNPTQLVEEAMDRLLDDLRFRAEVRKGFASLDRGEFLEEDEMQARVDWLLRH